MFGRILLPVLLMIHSVSYAGLFGDNQARSQINQLQEQLMQIETRIATVEETVNSQGLLEIYSQVESLGFEVSQLRGQIEVLSNQNELLQKRQKDFYIDLDNRLRQIEDPNAPIGTGFRDAPYVSKETAPDSESSYMTDAMSTSTTLSESSIDVPESNDMDESSVYKNAYNLFRNGDYSGAITQFEAFVDRFPRSGLASAAAYWVGNAHYALRNFQQSIDAQKNLIRTYPSSSKIPDALLNIASSQQEMGEKMAARTTLQDLIARYPFSNAAEKAKERMSD